MVILTLGLSREPLEGENKGFEFSSSKDKQMTYTWEVICFDSTLVQMLRSNSPQVRPRRLRNSSFSARSFAASSWRSLRFSASSETKLERSSLDDPVDGPGAVFAAAFFQL